MHVSSSYASDILGSFETDLELLNNWDAFRDLVPLHNLKNVKNTHGGLFF